MFVPFYFLLQKFFGKVRGGGGGDVREAFIQDVLL